MEMRPRWRFQGVLWPWQLLYLLPWIHLYWKIGFKEWIWLRGNVHPGPHVEFWTVFGLNFRREIPCPSDCWALSPLAVAEARRAKEPTFSREALIANIDLDFSRVMSEAARAKREAREGELTIDSEPDITGSFFGKTAETGPDA